MDGATLGERAWVVGVAVVVIVPTVGSLEIGFAVGLKVAGVVGRSVAGLAVGLTALGSRVGKCVVGWVVGTNVGTVVGCTVGECVVGWVVG